METAIKQSSEKSATLAYPLINFEDVNYTDPKTGNTLHDINFELYSGKNLLVLGPEGCGKDIFMSLLTCQKKPQSGQVSLLGRNIHSSTEKDLEIYRSCVAYISFNFGLINNLSLMDNIMLPMRYHTILKESEIIERVHYFLEKFHLMRAKDKRPQLLNQNEKLRAAFVRAIISQPVLILLDHALTGQCPLALSRFLELAKEELGHTNTSFVMTAFYPDQFQQFADKYILLYKGDVVFNGNKSDVEEMSNPYLRQYLQDPLHGPMKSFYDL